MDVGESSERRAQERMAGTAPIGEERTITAPSAAANGPAEDRLPAVSRDAYMVWEEVGQGGIGRVLRARDQRLGRPVAIKELLVWSEGHERRFVASVVSAQPDRSRIGRSRLIPRTAWRTR